MAVPFILMVVGFALVVAEVFFVSMGILSVLAGACIVIADVMAFDEGPAWGWIFIAIQAVGIPLLVWGAFRILPRLPFGRRMLLTGPVTEPGGGFPDLSHLVGRTGEALTPLRPSGMARFGDERVSVVGTGGMIPKGSEVEVVSVQVTEVKVRAIRVPEEED